MPFPKNRPASFKDKMHYLDDAVDWLITNKIAIVIELHDKPHMHSWEIDSWYVDQIMTFWRALVERYANRGRELWHRLGDLGLRRLLWVGSQVAG